MRYVDLLRREQNRNRLAHHRVERHGLGQPRPFLPEYKAHTLHPVRPARPRTDLLRLKIVYTHVYFMYHVISLYHTHGGLPDVIPVVYIAPSVIHIPVLPTRITSAVVVALLYFSIPI